MTRRKKRTARQPAKNPELVRRNEEMATARMMGATLRSIARAFGLSVGRVHAIVGDVLILHRRPNYRPPAKSSARPERAAHFRKLRSMALDLRKRGYSYRQIAEQTGLSRSAAHNYARRVKITELRGNARLSLTDGRPKEWKKHLMEKPPAYWWQSTP